MNLCWDDDIMRNVNIWDHQSGSFIYWVPLLGAFNWGGWVCLDTLVTFQLKLPLSRLITNCCLICISKTDEQRGPQPCVLVPSLGNSLVPPAKFPLVVFLSHLTCLWCYNGIRCEPLGNLGEGWGSKHRWKKKSWQSGF